MCRIISDRLSFSDHPQHLIDIKNLIILPARRLKSQRSPKDPHPHKKGSARRGSSGRCEKGKKTHVTDYLFSFSSCFCCMLFLDVFEGEIAFTFTQTEGFLFMPQSEDKHAGKGSKTKQAVKANHCNA